MSPWHRDAVLHKVRTALGRVAGQPAAPPPPPLMAVVEMDLETRIRSFGERFEALAGQAVRVKNAPEAREWVASFLQGRSAVASNSRFLADLGIHQLPGVQSGFRESAALRAACAVTDMGISSADFALAQTGTMVMIASPSEARLISLLPPVHVAVFPASRLLTGLDELLTILPKPAEQTSSMVLITGPSRTADIEQILVRGVHGPGQVYAVIVEGA